ncbi:MAG: helix-turn-helix transcriptional regulator [Firmicutes bacterium]|nr:helix-turn-helix transcriptional regulator [Bacillota bacterium]
MSNTQKVNMAIAYKGISLSDLAKAIGTSVQNLSQKMKRDSLSTAELQQIAVALGGTYVFGFEFPDGTKV